MFVFKAAQIWPASRSRHKAVNGNFDPSPENCVVTSWKTLLCEVVSVGVVKEPVYSVKLTVTFGKTALVKTLSTSKSSGAVTQRSRESFYTSVSQVLPTLRRQNHQSNQECATLTNYNIVQN